MTVQKIKNTIYTASAGAIFLASKAYAATEAADTAEKSVSTINDTVGAATDLNAQVALIINILIGIIGVAAVIMLIIGGFRYVFSQGEEKSTKGAKDTILYAIIGIVVALLAFAIVNFVLGGLGATTS